MKKSHVTDVGEKVCVASTPDKCRAIFNGEPAPHFRSLKEGREFYENALAEQNADSMQNKTQRKSRTNTDDNSRKLSKASDRLPTPTELGFPDRGIEPSDVGDSSLWYGGWNPKKTRQMRDDEQDELLSHLPQKQRDAIYFYTDDISESYMELLAYMRKDAMFNPNSDPARTKILDETISHLNEAITENSSGEERILYRGVSGNFAETCGKLPIGSQLSMPGFTSTSARSKATIYFMDSGEVEIGKDVVQRETKSIAKEAASVCFEMKTNKGMYLAGIECEQLLPSDTNWVVVGKRLSKINGYDDSTIFIQLIDADLLEDYQN